MDFGPPADNTTVNARSKQNLCDLFRRAFVTHECFHQNADDMTTQALLHGLVTMVS
jgi:hypothetical protein